MSKGPVEVFDRELLDLPAELRWREWMMRVEAAVFASPKPVPRSVLAHLIGSTVPLDEVIAAVQAELVARPYELVYVAGGWQHRTRDRYGAMLRHVLTDLAAPSISLSRREMELLATIAFHQPITRRDCEQALGRSVSGDDVSRLRAAGLIAYGHRRPGPGAPHTLITTPFFLEIFGLSSIADIDPCLAASHAEAL